jgi:hypothetical protein
MRYLFFLLLTVFANPIFAGESTYDQQLAVAAARAYVQSYLRLHPAEHAADLDWEHPRMQFVARPTGAFKGYVAVFFPEQHGSGEGHAYFEWSSSPGHLFVVEWGVTGSLIEEMSEFGRAAANGTLPRACAARDAGVDS